jgi:hypothetical protein
VSTLAAAGLFAVRDVFIYAVLAGVAAGVVTMALPWARAAWRFVVCGLCTTAGFIAWNLTLNVTYAKGFDTDAPVIAVSWQDAGSGVLAFVVTALVLAALWRREPAGRVVGAAALAGLTALVVDIFVL